MAAAGVSAGPASSGCGRPDISRGPKLLCKGILEGLYRILVEVLLGIL